MNNEQPTLKETDPAGQSALASLLTALFGDDEAASEILEEFGLEVPPPPPSYDQLQIAAADLAVADLLRTIAPKVSAETWIVIARLADLANGGSRIVADEIKRGHDAMRELHDAYLAAQAAVNSRRAHWDREIYHHIEVFAALSAKLGSAYYIAQACHMADEVNRYV